MQPAPKLSFVCPIPWQSMSGSEAARYCQVCRRTIPNLSLMSQAELQAFLERSKSEELCAAFYFRASGELITADDLPPDLLRRRIRQVGVSMAAASAMALAAGCVSIPKDGNLSQIPPPEVEATSSDAAAPDEDIVELLAFGIICTPDPPEVKGPASKRM